MFGINVLGDLKVHRDHAPVAGRYCCKLMTAKILICYTYTQNPGNSSKQKIQKKKLLLIFSQYSCNVNNTNND